MVHNTPTANEVWEIGALIQRLQSRFHGRVAIVNVTAGHVTFSHLIALSVEDGSKSVRVFSHENEALRWMHS